MPNIISVIKYEGDNQTFIWKHPYEDFSLGSQLIVHESQEAIFFMNGQALDLFGPGRYTDVYKRQIVDNTQVTIFGGFAPNSETAQVMSKSLGSRTVQSGSVSKGKDSGSQSLQMIERPLMTPDELKSMPKGQFIVMKTGAHPMKVKLKLFFQWGISFGAPYTVPDKGNRPVPYAGKETLIQAILEKYPPAPVVEEVKNESQEKSSAQQESTTASPKSGQKQEKKQGQQLKFQTAGKGRKVNATQPNGNMKQGKRKERDDDRP